jgi:hypothetical protein
MSVSEHARERKRKSRQRRMNLFVSIEALSRSFGIQPVVGGVGKTAHAETKMLELAVRAVKACKQNQNDVVVQQGVVHDSPEECKLAKESLMTSSTLGTMLIRTRDLTVLMSNRALANWWMFNNAGLSVGSGVEGRQVQTPCAHSTPRHSMRPPTQHVHDANRDSAEVWLGRVSGALCIGKTLTRSRPCIPG